MKTYIFFVRHAESPYIPGEERFRGLTDKGISDSFQIQSILKDEEIDLFISSPYERAIQTIKAAAGINDILIFEDLRERQIGDIPDDKFKESKQEVYQDFNFSFPEGESSNQAQERSIKVLLEVLNTYKGKKDRNWNTWRHNDSNDELL